MNANRFLWGQDGKEDVDNISHSPEKNEQRMFKHALRRVSVYIPISVVQVLFSNEFAQSACW